MNYYEILNISTSATKEEISLAHKRLAMKLHPDRHPNKPDIAEKFKQINIAYTTLNDPVKKLDYDNNLNEKKRNFQKNSTNADNRNFSQNSSNNSKNYSWGNQESTYQQDNQNFNERTSNQNNGNGYSYAKQPNNQSSNKDEIFIDVSIGFWEAIKGGIQSIAFSHRGEQFSVTIDLPSCIESGFIVWAETTYSTFQLKLHIEEDPIFTREGTDLYAGLDIPFHIALLGGNVIFPHWKNNKKINVKPNTQGGTEIILRGDGLYTKGIHGDLIIKCNIVFPKSLTMEQKNLIEKFVIIEDSKKESTYFNKVLEYWENMKQYLKSIGFA